MLDPPGSPGRWAQVVARLAESLCQGCCQWSGNNPAVAARCGHAHSAYRAVPALHFAHDLPDHPYNNSWWRMVSHKECTSQCFALSGRLCLSLHASPFRFFPLIHFPRLGSTKQCLFSSACGQCQPCPPTRVVILVLLIFCLSIPTTGGGGGFARGQFRRG